MDIGLFVSFDKAAGDVGAVVGNSLQVSEYILEDVAQLHCTLVVLQAADMAVLQLCAQVVHHLFKRLHLVSDAQVIGDIGVEGTLDILLYGVGYDEELAYALL